MPKNTKEQKDLEKEIKEVKKKTPAKKTTTKKAASSTRTTKKNTTSSNKKIENKIEPKNKVSKKATTKKTAKKSKSKSDIKKPEILEYYDLPYRYNQTIIKVLAQTPTSLFIYWDISDEDRKNLENQYGKNFFEITRPILIVYNDTLGYSFEVEINDFANSWYLHVADSKCNYRVELGRRPIQKTDTLNTNYVYVSTSNEIESPNDHILFDKNQKMVYFKDVKTGKKTKKSINTLSFIRNMEKIYDIYDLYKVMYKNENVEDIYDLSNPSS